MALALEHPYKTLGVVRQRVLRRGLQMEQMTIEVPGMKELLEEVSSLRLEIQMMKRCIPAKCTVSVSDIAELEGVSKSSLYGQEKYLLPRFGESAYPDGVTRWDTEEYLEWRRIPPTQRKQMYLKHIREEHLKSTKESTRKGRKQTWQERPKHQTQ